MTGSGLRAYSRAMLRRALLLVTAAVLSFSLAPVASAEPVKTVTVAHGPVTATVVPVIPGTASPGDLRLFHIALTRPGRTKTIGFLSGSLLTTAVGVPAVGKELRSADLVFTVGAAKNQLVIGGTAGYDQQAPTVAKKTSTIRPVLGGSGRYAGARGWCESVHRKDGTWRHTFHIRTS